LGDQLILKEGQRLEGRVIEDGEVVVLQVDGGKISFPAHEVAEIRRSPEGPLATLELRRRALSPTDIPKRLELARFALQVGLRAEATALHREVLELDPNRAESRAALGYVKRDGRWLSEEEVKAADGLVRYGGRWVPKAEAQTLEQERQARATARAKVEPSPPNEVPNPPARTAVDELAWGSDQWLGGPPPLTTAGWYYGGWASWSAPFPRPSPPRAGLNVHLSGSIPPASPAIHVGARAGASGAVFVGGRSR
jgi:hypothetical protein